MTKKFFTAYSKKRRVVTVNKEPSMTQQSFKNECDINRIVGQYKKHGVMTHLNTSQANYGVAPSHTFHEAMNIVIQAQEMFDSLPSQLRKEFSNDPASFLEFVENPENIEDMVEMGLIEKNDADNTTHTSSNKDKNNVDGDADKQVDIDDAQLST